MAGYTVVRSQGSSCAQPINLYGPGDNFDLESSHVLPALIRKFHEAKVARAPEVTVWGTGTPRREFLHVDDLADALVFLADAPGCVAAAGDGVEAGDRARGRDRGDLSMVSGKLLR